MLLALALGLLACREEPAPTPDPVVDEDEDGYPAAVDCDDSNPDIHPGMQELCNGADDDCDLIVDEDPVDGDFAYMDADGDGFGGEYRVSACDGPPEGFVAGSTDCDDLDASVFPGAEELCNGLDDDCDGEADEELEGSVFYADADGDGYGTSQKTTILCGAEEGWVDNFEDCDDSSGEVNPAADEVCDDGIDNDCDGEQERCSFEELLAGDARTRIFGEFEGDYFGSPVKNVGDLNANALDELAVAARGSDLSAEDAGAIYLFQLPLSGGDVGAESADTVILGEGAGDEVFSVAGLGDSNGDGVGDLVIGARRSDDGGEDAGKIYFLQGPFDEVEYLEDAGATWSGVGAGDNAGLVMASDLNGDGEQDIVVGAQKNDNGGTNAGAVFILNGPFGSWLGDQGLYAADAFLKGEAGSQFGGGMAPVGDLDGDGVGDLLVGAPYENANGADAGAIYQLNGPISGKSTLASRADARFVANEGDQAGWGIAAAGDVDGDGLSDFLVNAQRADIRENNANEGAVYVVTGDWTGSVEVSLDDTWLKIHGINAEDKLASVSGEADFDGDGHVDLLLGTRFHDASAEDAGAVWIVYGPHLSGAVDLEDIAGARIDGKAAGDGFGAPAGAIGDLDGDGGDELAIGARWNDDAGEDAGAAYIFWGSSL